MVRDGNAVSMAGQIAKNAFRSTGRSLGIDDTLLGEELAQEAAEALRSGQCPKRAVNLPPRCNADQVKSIARPPRNDFGFKEEVHRFNPDRVHQSNQQLSESLRKSDAEGPARILFLSEVSGIPVRSLQFISPTRGAEDRSLDL